MLRVSLRSFTAAALALCVCAPHARSQQGEPPLLTVNGEAQIRIVPDEVILTLGVETSEKDLRVSKSRNDERVKRVLALGREFGIDPKLIQTDHISVEPWYRHGSDRPESLEYRVRKTVIVTLREVPKFEDLLSRALEAGATHVHGVQFRTTELRRHRDAARSLAVKAAREKAEALAAELGQRVGRAYRVYESGGGWYSDYGAGWSHRWAGGAAQNSSQFAGGQVAPLDGAIALGQITVNAAVSVSFRLD